MDDLEPDPVRLTMCVLGAPFAAYALVSPSLLVVGWLYNFSIARVGLPAIPVEIGFVIGHVLPWPLALAAAALAVVAPRSRRWLLCVYEVLLFLVLPVWGLIIDLGLPACDACTDTNRPVAWPGAVVVYAAFLVGLTAHVVARIRSGPLPVAAEAMVLAGLAIGTAVCTALNLQFVVQSPFAVLFPMIGLPMLAPFAIAMLWPMLLVWRAVHHPRWLASSAIATAMASVFAALDLVVTRIWTGELGLFAGALTRTCGWTFSQMVPPSQDCHYLCTVAAQGHPWLVRPLRTGVRHGRPIVVNRQLAVANAFEDLLHERWPRFGRWARRAYDRLGLPISRYLLHPLAADAVFVMMLPAQAAFELFLRVLDRDPEGRIDRMYR